MSSSIDIAKTLLLPAFISLTLYLILSYILLPFYTRYRQRYSNYLPMSRLSVHTLPIRERIADSLMEFFLPSAPWRRRVSGFVAGIVPGFMRRWFGDDDDLIGSDSDEEEEDGEERRRRNNLDNTDSISIFDEEGENMTEMNFSDSTRGYSYGHGGGQGTGYGGGGGGFDDQVRLSRELEQGFMDDSDSDDSDDD